MAHVDKNEQSFFERERERLTKEIVASFDELLSSTNHLNRQMEEVLLMSKEYGTVASLWSAFHQLMKTQGSWEHAEGEDANEDSQQQNVLDVSAINADADETVRMDHRRSER